MQPLAPPKHLCAVHTTPAVHTAPLTLGRALAAAPSCKERGMMRISLKPHTQTQCSHIHSPPTHTHHTMTMHT